MNAMIIRRLGLALVAGLLALAAFAASAMAAPLTEDLACPQANFGPAAEFGVCNFDGQIAADPAGESFTQAAGHPYDLTTDIYFNTKKKTVDLGSALFETAFPVEPPKDVLTEVPVGLLANPLAVPTCSLDQLNFDSLKDQHGPLCPPASQVGQVDILSDGLGALAGQGPVGVIKGMALFNMVPPPGAPARFGFAVSSTGTNVVLDAKLRGDGDYGFNINSVNTAQKIAFNGVRLTFWGVPGAAGHDPERACPGEAPPVDGGPTCVLGASGTPFLRLPTSCTPPGEGLDWATHIDSWWNPGGYDAAGFPNLADPNWRSGTFESHDPPGLSDDPEGPEAFPGLFPSEGWGGPRGIEDCADVPVKGQIAAQPTSQSAETASGLNVTVSIPNPGLENPGGISSSDIRKTVVSLPEGVTINPSQGEGLGVCTPAQYASTELSFHPDPSTGCPPSSKIGTVDVKTPLLSEAFEGSVFVAKPYENPSNSLVGLYIVIQNPERGIQVKLAGEVEPDERTGQLVATFDDIPQVPFSTFNLYFREGVRSPLATPRTCGDYTTEAQFTPWSDPSKTITSKSTFKITHGVGGGPCPSGAAPFNPQLQAGSLNNNALSYSPFTLRMIREDGEQEITNFSADLPKGLAAKLAGIPKCSEADLAATAAAPGVATINGSICPAASQVGRVTAGYGVGSVQTHATGKVFLAGPYRGTPVSIATVVPAVVGPFDVGTIVVRSAFRVDPETAEVHVDSKASDPIPHILKGIELHLRDLRVYMDRPGFTFNPTNCNKLEVGAFLSGSGADFTSRADDPTVDVSNPFQAANCSLLLFKPKLAFKLRGGTHRGDFPALRATLKARPGDANLGRAVVTLPHSAFLEQGHIKTVCTRVQFNADACPAGSVYGHVVATTPLLDHPLSGNVYLRSNGGERILPDLVMALRGEINVNAIGFVDSVKGGGIRTTFQTIPDTPVTKLVLNMQGGKKGLFVNSRNLCLEPSRADVHFTGQNGKAEHLRPLMGTSCKKAGRGHKRHR